MVIKQKIMYESPEAARLVSMTMDGKEISKGWLSVDNCFFTEERNARYRSHTHSLCECGGEAERGYTCCPSCIANKKMERFKALPFKEWDGVTPLCIYGDDKFFFSSDDIDEYLEEQGLNSDDLMLVVCTELHYNTIDEDYWEDVLPEDGEIPETLKIKLIELNNFIKTLPVASYYPDNIRTKYNPIH